MKLKNSQIRSSYAVIENLVKAPLPFRAKLTVSKAKKALGEVHEVYEQSFQELIQNYVKTDEDGNPVVPLDDNGKPVEGQVIIDDTKSAEFNQKFIDLNNEEVDIGDHNIELTPEVEEALTAVEDFDPTSILWLFDE